MLGVTPVTLYRWRKQGLLKPAGFAGGYLYSLADVLQVLAVRGGLVPIAVLPSRKLRARVRKNSGASGGLAPSEKFFTSLPSARCSLRGRTRTKLMPIETALVLTQYYALFLAFRVDVGKWLKVSERYELAKDIYSSVATVLRRWSDGAEGDS